MNIFLLLNLSSAKPSPDFTKGTGGHERSNERSGERVKRESETREGRESRPWPAVTFHAHTEPDIARDHNRISCG